MEMKSSLFLGAMLLLGVGGAQAAPTAAYDSLQNFMGEKIKAYVGQELTVRPRTGLLQKVGYAGFYTSMNPKDVYQEATKGYTSYDKLNGRTFKVTGIATRAVDVAAKEKPIKWKTLSPDSVYYLTLTDGTEKLYYKYTSRFEESFPFTVKGFLDKMTRIYEGDSYYLINIVDRVWKDAVTGKDVMLHKCSLWNVSDVCLDKDCMTMVAAMKSDKGETVNMNLNSINTYFKTKAYIDGLKHKYTPAVFNKTVISMKINPGTPAELVKVAMGTEPTKVVKAKGYEIWYFGTQQVKVKNGKVLM
jgi:hypothetical protein